MNPSLILIEISLPHFRGLCFINEGQLETYNFFVGIHRHIYGGLTRIFLILTSKEWEDKISRTIAMQRNLNFIKRVLGITDILGKPIGDKFNEEDD